jgi:predicted RNA polymerase sigma factor
VEIGALYGELARLTGSPIVELNRTIAIAETDGAERRFLERRLTELAATGPPD